ncbi:regulatory protein GemA [Pseudodesulfovibrio senegalensis]|uniref:Regulatory protein GemA n=1 Tax=Pseudodesulfovibrio senegalensis TaxID=1721087 RepID=A0A6N6MZZ1_9BACT|nr:regulatory protein GemA [Pseudodesulfovibrio senegalensis]KAB1440357.1 regulatory protein GemA [Pseudodesulfovibrio senegalensis]
MAMTTKGKRWRTGLIKKAKTIQNQVLHMSAEDYETMLLVRYDKSSTADLSIDALKDLCAHLQKLAGQTKIPALPDAQARKIWTLWQELHKAGEVRDPNEQALNAFVKGQTKKGGKPGVGSYRWLNRHQASTIIESLKNWQKRIIKEKTAV